VPLQRENRKLAAIVAADVVGYSRLTGQDEEGTVRALRAHRQEFIDQTIAEYGGRIANTAGDSLLLEFSSAVDAVRCSIAFQEGMAKRNSSVATDRKIRFRIGINIGDVIAQGSDIVGEGVNIAARLEGLSEPGGILLSDDAYRQVHTRIKEVFVGGGPKRLKNIAEPVTVWRWSPDGAKSDPGEASPDVWPAVTALPLPDKPSIVVLPFDNMSGDPEQEYFSDGMSEDIITDLSKVSELFVIARSSAFSFKGKAGKIPEICAELGVRYALEGSVRKAGGRVRINAQLIDGISGGHLWADRYDRELDDIFEVQDEVTRKIVAALKIELSPAEKLLIIGSGTRNVAAHDYFLKGRELLFGIVSDAQMFEAAKTYFQNAIDLDADYSTAYARLAMGHILDFQNGWSGTGDAALKKATQFSELAIAKDNDDFFAHYVAAVVAMFSKDLDRVAVEAGKALKLNPNFGLAINARGIVSVYSGEPLKAIPDIEAAMRLDPMGRERYLQFLGTAYFVAGDFERAAAAFRERVALNPITDLGRSFLASALGQMGQYDEARKVWDALMKINPNYSQADHLSRLPFKKRSDTKPFTDGLKLAGLPRG